MNLWHILAMTFTGFVSVCFLAAGSHAAAAIAGAVIFLIELVSEVQRIRKNAERRS